MKMYWLLLVLLSGCTSDPLALAEEESVKGNHRKAVELYSIEAEKGNSKAQFHYGLALLRAKGIERNCKEGMEWLVKSSGHGNANASFAIYIYTRNGVAKCGVKNVKIANKYKEIAIKQGYEIDVK